MQTTNLTLSEVADYLKLTLSDVKTLMESGELQTTGDDKVIRFRPEVVKAYAEANPKAPAEKSTDTRNIGQNAKITALPAKHEEMVTQTTAPTIKAKIEAINDARNLAVAETGKVLAEIALAEAQGKRDKPEALDKREAELKEREATLTAREKTLKSKEESQARRDIVIDDKEKKTEQSILGKIAYHDNRKKDADDYYVQKKSDADLLLSKGQEELNVKANEVIVNGEKYAEELKAEAQKEADGIRNEISSEYNASKFELDNLQIEYDNKLDEVGKADAKIAEAQETYKKVVAYLPQVQNHAIQHYNTAVKSSGSTANFHHAQANRGWDIEKELQKILKWIGI